MARGSSIRYEHTLQSQHRRDKKHFCKDHSPEPTRTIVFHTPDVQLPPGDNNRFLSHILPLPFHQSPHSHTFHIMMRSEGPLLRAKQLEGYALVRGRGNRRVGESDVQFSLDKEVGQPYRGALMSWGDLQPPYCRGCLIT